MRRRDLGGGPAVTSHAEGHGDPQQVWLSFPVVAGDAAELELVAGRVDKALTEAGVVLVSPPKLMSGRPVVPKVARAKGVHYDEDERRLGIAPHAGPLELTFLGPHAGGEGTAVILVSHEARGRMEQAFVVSTIHVAGPRTD